MLSSEPQSCSWNSGSSFLHTVCTHSSGTQSDVPWLSHGCLGRFFHAGDSFLVFIPQAATYINAQVSARGVLELRKHVCPGRAHISRVRRFNYAVSLLSIAFLARVLCQTAPAQGGINHVPLALCGLVCLQQSSDPGSRGSTRACRSGNPKMSVDSIFLCRRCNNPLPSPEPPGVGLWPRPRSDPHHRPCSHQSQAQK